MDVWMFYSITLNNKINHLHERALRIVYSDSKLWFCELLGKYKSFSIYHKKYSEFSHQNLQVST